MVLFRRLLGEVLRAHRVEQGRTLRQLSADARVSLGYMSEIERGRKEASSELLAAICGALDVELSELFTEVSQTLRREEKLAAANPVALVGTASAHPGGAQVRTLPVVAA